MENISVENYEVTAEDAEVVEEIVDENAVPESAIEELTNNKGDEE